MNHIPCHLSQLNETSVFNHDNTVIRLSDFIDEFKDSLLASLNASNPPVYLPENASTVRQHVMDGLLRKPFLEQANVIQAISALLLDKGSPAGVINAEMGTGKSMMSICVAAILHQEGYRRTLVLSPPHLVYKWRREIEQTVPDARVWILNGPDTLMQLLKLRETLHLPYDGKPEFFILGRVRMRMGFHWKMTCVPRLAKLACSETELEEHISLARIYTTEQGDSMPDTRIACCPDCYRPVYDTNGKPSTISAFFMLDERIDCEHCHHALWTLTHPSHSDDETNAGHKAMIAALCKIPTIGKATAQKLIDKFGTEFLAGMLADNVFNFINLMDERGELVFSDRQAVRMEKAFRRLEFGFGQGGYPASEFIKRYLPQDFFSLMIIDEGHEYKNLNSAQGQAMGVIASKTKKRLVLTGTLMGGYADDLLYLLFRILPTQLAEDGFKPNERGSFAKATATFISQHGILEEVHVKREKSLKTAKGSPVSVKTRKRPGFGPKGILRYVLPYTAFLKLRDIGSNVLPNYQEEFVEIDMSDEQNDAYKRLSSDLLSELRRALRNGDKSLMGVVINTLLAWPDCCFRAETVCHPNKRELLHEVEALFSEDEMMPKEVELLKICKETQAKNRKTLVFSTYTGTRDTTMRLKYLLQKEGLKVSVLKSSVPADEREEWIMAREDEGIDVLITNPENVKTGLDLLAFPTIVFLQTGYNVYTLMQASRRSFRIGQKQDVRVIFLGYKATAQIECLQLMAQKIAVSQSTSGEMPESGLDILNPEGDSVEMALARQLVALH